MRNFHVSWLITSPSGKTRSNQDTHLSQKKLLSAPWAAQRQRHQLTSVPSQSWHSQQTQWSWLPVRVPRVAQQGVLAAQPLEGRVLSGIKKMPFSIPKVHVLDEEVSVPPDKDRPFYSWAGRWPGFSEKGCQAGMWSTILSKFPCKKCFSIVNMCSRFLRNSNI